MDYKEALAKAEELKAYLEITNIDGYNGPESILRDREKYQLWLALDAYLKLYQ